MIISTRDVDIEVDGSAMLTHVLAPKIEGRYLAVLCYSDIFQFTGPMQRTCARLAGHGFVVAAPEIYHRIEAPGTAITFDDDGRTRGLENASHTSVAEFDADCRATLDYLSRHANVSGGIGVLGFCIGGHLAFRAGMQPRVSASVCCYPTGLNDGKLGKDVDAGSLARAREIKGEMLMIFGTGDPHVPKEARVKIEAALKESDVNYRIIEYDAEHAFMRDEGPRYDAEATDSAFEEIISFFSARLTSK